MATAISYGPARMGFGLFVPEFKPAFSLSTADVGIISSIGFAGFFVGLVIAQILLNRRGPEVPVLSGLAAATGGLGIVALAPNAAVLAAGVFLAASSAGFAWTPFNDAVHRKIRDVDRPTALSEISTGTSVGIALAGAMALAMVLTGFDWRVCWGAFATASGAAFLANWAALRHVDKAPEAGPKAGWQDVLRIGAVPLFAIAFVYGVTSAVYISFAAQRFADSGGYSALPDRTAPALIFVCYGLFGLAGLATGRLRTILGLPLLVRVLMLMGAGSLALAALMPGGWVGLISSAGLQGMNVMMTSAVLAFWSERLFPRVPALGFTSTLLFTAAGSVFGPALAGLAATSLGAFEMLFGVAMLPLAIVLVVSDNLLQDRPAQYREKNGPDEPAVAKGGSRSYPRPEPGDRGAGAAAFRTMQETAG